MAGSKLKILKQMTVLEESINNKEDVFIEIGNFLNVPLTLRFLVAGSHSKPEWGDRFTGSDHFCNIGYFS